MMVATQRRRLIRETLRQYVKHEDEQAEDVIVDLPRIEAVRKVEENPDA